MRESQAHAAAGRSTGPGPTILVSANSCWNIVNFRAGLIGALQDRGYRIAVAAPDDEYRSKVEDLGVEFMPVPINSPGISVAEDLRLLARYMQVFRQLKPFAFLGFTAKPNIYGSLAARLAGVKVINNISGLGTVFIKRGPLTALVTRPTASPCAARRPIAYSETFSAPDAPTVVPLEAGYKIAPLDTVTVKVFKMPDLSGDYEVDLTGQISMPLIGEVPAVDLTTAQLDRRLTDKLGERYLENPDVSVGVKASTRRSVTVDGAVNKSGSYPITGPVTLMQAVASAGGTTPEANARRVAVFRQVGGKRQAAAFDLVAIRRGQAEDPAIYPGDIVVVDGSSIKAAQKQILNSLPILSIFRPF